MRIRERVECAWKDEWKKIEKDKQNESKARKGVI